MNNTLVRRLAELERRHAPPARRETLEQQRAQSMADLIAAFGEDDVAAALGISISELYSGNPETREEV